MVGDRQVAARNLLHQSAHGLLAETDPAELAGPQHLHARLHQLRHGAAEDGEVLQQQHLRGLVALLFGEGAAEGEHFEGRSGEGVLSLGLAELDAGEGESGSFLFVALLVAERQLAVVAIQPSNPEELVAILAEATSVLPPLLPQSLFTLHFPLQISIIIFQSPFQTPTLSPPPQAIISHSPSLLLPAFLPRQNLRNILYFK